MNYADSVLYCVNKSVWLGESSTRNKILKPGLMLSLKQYRESRRRSLGRTLEALFPVKRKNNECGQKGSQRRMGNQVISRRQSEVEGVFLG